MYQPHTNQERKNLVDKKKILRKCHRYYRFAWQIFLGIGMVMCFCYLKDVSICFSLNKESCAQMHPKAPRVETRQLLEFPDDFLLERPYHESGQKYFLFVHTLIMIYMFVALAIACDEYFVASMEYICERFQLSEDVAGATFMAAGGSAPEFFTSLVGVFFAKSDVGFGTIVGSAVFNVLFVIALCAIFAHEPLQLTWWPLVRDTTYYCVSLAILAFFIRDNAISWHEAFSLFVLYIGYVFVMKHNEVLNEWVHKIYHSKSKKTATFPQNDSETPTAARAVEQISITIEPETKPLQSSPEVSRAIRIPNLKTNKASSQRPLSETEGTTTSLAIQQDQSIDRYSIEIMLPASINVSRLPLNQVRDSNGTFVPADNPKSCSNSDIQSSKTRSRPYPMMRSASGNLFVDKNGRIRSIQGLTFDLIRKNKSFSGFVSRKAAFKSKSSREKDDFSQGNDYSSVIDVICDQGDGKQLEGLEVGVDMLIEENGGKEEEEEEEEEKEHALKCPQGYTERFFYIILFPINLVLFLTLPDCKRKKFQHLYMVTFFLSLIWIALFTYVMVWMVDTIGQAIGISDIIRGLTILAAGTSVPDAVSSVIVARQGFGDMAVSSSIGSNIFDILVGLPIPWLLKTAIVDPGSTVRIYSDNLLISVITLLCMVLLVVLSIRWTKWVLDKKLGWIMGLLYVIFLLQNIILETHKKSV